MSVLPRTSITTRRSSFRLWFLTCANRVVWAGKLRTLIQIPVTTLPVLRRSLAAPTMTLHNGVSSIRQRSRVSHTVLVMWVLVTLWADSHWFINLLIIHAIMVIACMSGTLI